MPFKGNELLDNCSIWLNGEKINDICSVPEFTDDTFDPIDSSYVIDPFKSCEFTGTIEMSVKSFKRTMKLLRYGWTAKGPVRIKQLERAFKQTYKMEVKL